MKNKSPEEIRQAAKQALMIEYLRKLNATQSVTEVLDLVNETEKLLKPLLKENQKDADV